MPHVGEYICRVYYDESEVWYIDAGWTVARSDFKIKTGSIL